MFPCSRYLELDREFSVKKVLPYRDNINFWRSLGDSVYWNRVLKVQRERREKGEQKKEGQKKDEL